MMRYFSSVPLILFALGMIFFSYAADQHSGRAGASWLPIIIGSVFIVSAIGYGYWDWRRNKE